MDGEEDHSICVAYSGMRGVREAAPYGGGGGNDILFYDGVKICRMLHFYVAVLVRLWYNDGILNRKGRDQLLWASMHSLRNSVEI